MRPILLLVSFLLATVVAPLPSEAQRSLLHFQQVSEAASIVHAVLQDDTGFLWLGTSEGLFRYDGHHFRAYRYVPGDTTSLSGDHVLTLYEDREGVLWVGTRGAGLNRYDRTSETFTRYRHDPADPASLSDNDVFKIYEDRRGTLWIGTTGGGLNRFDRHTEAFTHYRHDPADPASLSDNTVLSIYEDREGVLWIGLKSRFGRFDRSSGTFAPLQGNDPGGAIWGRPVVEDRKGRLWIGTEEGGICRLDRATDALTCYRDDPEDPVGLGNIPVTAIHEDASGMLWLGTWGGGLYRFDPDTGRFERHLVRPGSATTLSNNYLRAIYEDRAGVLWLGTYGGGLNSLARATPPFTVYVPPGHEPSVWAVAEAQADTLWLATRGGLHRLERRTGRWTSFLHDPDDPTSISHSQVTALHQEPSGTLWIGTGDGLNRYDPRTGTFTRYRHDPADPTSLSDQKIYSLYEDRAGRLWVGIMGTGRGGLNLLDRDTGTFTHFLHDPADPTSIGPGQLNSMLEDSRGRFWVATNEGGLNLMDRRRGTFMHFMHDPNDPASLSSNDLTQIVEDRAGWLWIGSWDGGLNRFDPETGTALRFTRRTSCLPSDRIPGLLSDDRGHLWLNTGSGIVRFDPEARTCATYDARDGLVNPHSFPGDAYRSPRGEFFFGTFGGAHSFFPQQVAGSAEPPPVVLTGLSLLNRPVAPAPAGPLPTSITAAEEIVLAHDQNSIGFTFAALHFLRPDENQYAYRLEGFDRDWVHAGTRNSATYTNLGPGRYAFRVKAANADGVWNEEGTAIQVTVLPPWWETWWAYLLYGLFGMVSVYTIDRTQRRRLIRKERARAQITEARLQTQAAEAQARALRAENERKEAQLEKARALEAAHRQLEAHAQRLAEMDAMKSRFFANISHEFRTPLTLILGPVRDALQGDPERGIDRRELVRIERNGQRLLHLINQLLDLSKLETGSMHLRPQGMDLVDFLKGLTLAFSTRAEREDIVLSFHSTAAQMPARFDPDQMEKVVTNLISNALDFTPSGGKVHLSVVQIDTAAESMVEVTVKDTGAGIPADKLPFVFDRFYQVDGSATRAREGAGIGLSLAKEIVELHGGTIDVSSDVGFGTTFRFRFPVGAACEGPEYDNPPNGAGLAVRHASTWAVEDEAPPLPQPSVPADAPLVLIVEDNADVQSYLQAHLGVQYRIETAHDGMKGLVRARELQPDLIVSDVMMPLLDGLDLCRAVKEDPELHHIPVILLTARADEKSKLEGLQFGADDYLTKPFSGDELLARAENLIEVRRLLRQRFSGAVLLMPGEISVTSTDAAFLERVRGVVEAHLGDGSFGVERLADEVGLSTRQLHRRMKELTRLSPGGYVRMVRLERAAQLLAQGAGNVSEVAHTVGFNSASYFARVFAHSFGKSPSEFSAASQ